ncbi:hypothetical protein C5E51_03545 [Nocardia nova]|nr:hypothetical protein C5E51_03545 [Nocardia nova]
MLCPIATIVLRSVSAIARRLHAEHETHAPLRPSNVRRVPPWGTAPRRSRPAGTGSLPFRLSTIAG